MTFEDLMSLLEGCTNREKKRMFEDEIADASTNFINTIVCICEKYGKDANKYVALTLSTAMTAAREFNFNKRKGEKDK